MYTSVEKAREIRTEFEKLLAQDLPEQAYQDFIERHTELMPREFVQNHGIHFHVVLRKLDFGGDLQSDFFYFSKSSDNWNAVFIELESPHAKFFSKNSNSFSPDFQKGLQQINSWRAWLSDDANARYFLDNTVRILHVPIHMARNKTNFKFVLVSGRRSEYEGNQYRRSLVAAQETPDFSIISYDSLMEELVYKYPLFIAARHHDHLEILTDDFVDSSAFVWIDPSLLRVSKALHATMKAAGGDHHKTMFEGKMVDAVPLIVDKLRIR